MAAHNVDQNTVWHVKTLTELPLVLSEQLPQHRGLFSFLAPLSAVGFPCIVRFAGDQRETSTEALSEDKLVPLTIDIADNADS